MRISKLMVAQITDRLHVSASPAEVEANMRGAFNPAAAPDVIEAYVKAAHKRHAKNKKLYSRVMSGTL